MDSTGSDKDINEFQPENILRDVQELHMETLVLIMCLLSNTLHVITVSNFKKRVQPVEIARILPSGFLIMITMTMVPIEVYTVNSQQGYNTNIYDLIADKLEFLQIATLLGLNFLGAITKLRSYRCKGPAAISITRTSVIIPAFVIVASSITVTSTLCLYRPLVQNRTVRDTDDYIALSVELFIYHTFEIIPTMAVYIAIFVYALQYYKLSSKKVKSFGIKSDITPQGKQLCSVTISVLFYLITFLLSWIPFFTIKIIAIVLGPPSEQLPIEKVKFCLKMSMFWAYPVADGMLLKRNRKKIRFVFLKTAHFFSPVVKAITNFFTSSILFDILHTLIPRKHIGLQCEKQTINKNENCKLMYTAGTYDVSNTKMLDINDKDRKNEFQLSYRRQMRSLPRIEIHQSLNNPDDLDISKNSSYGTFGISPSFNVPQSHSASTLPYDRFKISSSANVLLSHSASTSPYDGFELFNQTKSHSATTSPLDSTKRFFLMNNRGYPVSGKTFENFSQKHNKTDLNTSIQTSRFTLSPNNISKRMRFVYSSSDIRAILHNSQSETETLLLSDFDGETQKCLSD